MISGETEVTAVASFRDDVRLGVEIVHGQPDHFVQAEESQLVSYHDHVPDLSEEVYLCRRDVDERRA